MSSNDIEDHINKLIYADPTTIYSAAAGILGGLFMVVEITTLGIVVTGSAFLITAGTLFVNKVIRKEHFMRLSLKNIHLKQEAKVKSRIKNVLDSLRGFDNYNTDLQVSRIIDKIKTFNDILKARFSGEGLAYQRFLGVSDTILSNALTSYDEIVLLFRQSRDINEDYCIKQVELLIKEEDDSRNIEQIITDGDLNKLKNVEKIKALTMRVQVKQDIEEQIRHMLLQNELAMTRMDLTLAGFADFSTEKELEWAMKELSGLSIALTSN